VAKWVDAQELEGTMPESPSAQWAAPAQSDGRVKAVQMREAEAGRMKRAGCTLQ